ncbi:RHOMBOID-like protein 12, mitochondrial isoform X1 [Canna indica]|uniref:RHOMBOID-like protein 12, mitochondrial isoform X1 n=1 Tax=Canna indica TaxID=4628 RepID=A0AAQ3K9Y0_9LILI|nr:RHOMBOID-like protein 12, mitochondrial isoform X1 [Canna indica]
MRRNNGKLLGHQLHHFLTKRGSSVPSSHGRFIITSAPGGSCRASSLPGLLPRPCRSNADPHPLASPFAFRGLLACRRLLPRPARTADFCAAPAVGLKGLVVDGVRALKISFQRRSGFDPKRFLSRAQRSLGSNWIPGLGGNEVVFGLLGANVAVFLLWRIADPAFMRNHFMISLDNFKRGRLHTLITSSFSHSDTDHLITNMIGLYFFGSSIANLFGPNFLLKLYLAGALGGSVFYLLHKAFMVPSTKGYRGWDESRIPALGASAAVNAIILLNVFLFPKNIYYINFVIPVPAALMGAFLIGTDLWRIKKGEGHIAGSAHLGGAVVAALVWARLRHWI